MLGKSQGSGQLVGHVHANNASTQSEIAYVTQRLEAAISRLEGSSVDLHQKLLPVVIERLESADTSPGNTERVINSDLGRGIMAFVHRVEELERRADILLSALAI